MSLRLSRRAAEAVPIDIAPMIDMVFQLLLFFMLTSSFIIHPGIRVTLPKATTSQTMTRSDIRITLTKDHLIYWDEDILTFKELKKRLNDMGGGKPVLIRADRYAYVDKLVTLWDLCRETGYQEVHIATLSE